MTCSVYTTYLTMAPHSSIKKAYLIGCIILLTASVTCGSNESVSVLPNDVLRHTIAYASNQALGRLSSTDQFLFDVINKTGILEQRKEMLHRARIIQVIKDLKAALWNNHVMDILDLRNSSNELVFNKYLCGFYGQMEYFLQMFWMSATHGTWIGIREEWIAHQTIALKKALKKYKQTTQFDERESLRAIIGNTSNFNQIASILNKCKRIIQRIEHMAEKDRENTCFVLQIIPDIRMLMQRMVQDLSGARRRRIAQGWRRNVLKAVAGLGINPGGPEFCMARPSWRRRIGRRQLIEIQARWKAPHLQPLRQSIVHLMENEVSQFITTM